MAGPLAALRNASEFFEKQRHIIWALLMREISTRYGRDDIGFLWLLIEPALFCTGVTTLYTYIRPPFEFGLTVPQFTITGYMPMILFRQMVNFSAPSSRVNAPLLYHRQITPLQLFFSRALVEFCGVSLSYMMIIAITCWIGIMPLPKNILLFVCGWLMMTFQALGCAMFMNALSEMFDVVERIVPILTYLFLPVSGAFYMVSGLPAQLRSTALLLPFVHCFEMMRGGYFGEFLPVTYSVSYALAWGAGFVLFGLLLMQFVRPKVEVL